LETLTKPTSALANISCTCQTRVALEIGFERWCHKLTCAKCPKVFSSLGYNICIKLHHHFACRLTAYADIEKDSRIWGLFSHFSFLFSFRENQTSYIELKKVKNRCSATLTNPFLLRNISKQPGRRKKKPVSQKEKNNRHIWIARSAIMDSYTHQKNIGQPSPRKESEDDPTPRNP
jgi:hypothetical protein